MKRKAMIAKSAGAAGYRFDLVMAAHRYYAATS